MSWTYHRKEIERYNKPHKPITFFKWNLIRLAVVATLTAPKHAIDTLIIQRLEEVANIIEHTNAQTFSTRTTDDLIALSYEVSLRVKRLAEAIHVKNIDILTEIIEGQPGTVDYRGIYALVINGETIYL